MTLHLLPVQQADIPLGILEFLESADPRVIEDHIIQDFAARIFKIALSLSQASDGEDREMLNELVYGAGCVEEHFTPRGLTARDLYWQSKDTSRKLAQGEAVR